MNILISLLLFSLIVVFHEFGHFLFARTFGVKVLEFAVGMGPRLVSCKRGETEYSLNLLPFGGYCRMLGEDLEEYEEAPEDFTPEERKALEEENRGRSFADKPVWQRFLIVAAGPVFNFILAFFLAIFIVFWCGVDTSQISGVMEGYPAEAAGLQEGDEIVALDGHQVVFFREVSAWFDLHAGDPVQVTVKRGNDRYTTTIVPKYNEERGAWFLGILSKGGRIEADTPAKLLYYAFHEVRFTVTSTFDGLVMLIRGKLSPEYISGPVGIVNTIGETVEETKSYGLLVLMLNLMNLGLILSANLGVMNLLPIPALDGGRLLFFAAEALFRRRLDRRVEGYIHLAGFVLLMGFMIFVMLHDIVRIIR